MSALQYLTSKTSLSLGLLPRSLIFLLHQMYDGNVATLDHQVQRLISMCRRFVDLYGPGPVSILRAPARINIFGEHIDYVSYLPTASLPFGSREHDMLMLYRATSDERVRGASTLKEYSPFSFSLSEAPISGAPNADAEWLSYLAEHPARAPGWSNYVRGPLFHARMRSHELRYGFDFIVDSTIPAGGGASSSSALVVLAGAAVLNVNGIAYEPMELARDVSKAEWYVGTRGGAMDHITICLAKKEHAVLISFSNQEARQIPLPDQEFCWITFFSHAADKGREVMIEYNERAAVSRIIIPALIEGWRSTHPERHAAWIDGVQSFISGSIGALDELEEILHQLPEALSLNDVEQNYPRAYSECARSFPVLVAERRNTPLQLRTRALHHLGEVRRVNKVVQILESDGPAKNIDQQEKAMRLLGDLSNESHASLRDLYQVSNTDVERLIEIIRGSPGVYGARLMGGGFGGNVLVLASREKVASLIESVQQKYYSPENRQGVRDGLVMISTPGDGLTSIELESVWREAIEEFNSYSSATSEHLGAVHALLDSIPRGEASDEVWPVIVAAGKGTRFILSGLTIPKPLAPVLDTPAIVHVLQNIRTAFGKTRKPIVIASPETADPIRSILDDYVTIVIQAEARGTGDAVLCAYEPMKGFQGRALVIWGTQPVIQGQTMRRTLTLAKLFENYDMIVPTTVKDTPYAPVLRDKDRRVRGAEETHLEQAHPLDSGETNIGMFMLKAPSMFKALTGLRKHHWNDRERRYMRSSGELGFPNELINYFAQKNSVFACPIADPREEQGIKELVDLSRCEKFISELATRDYSDFNQSKWQ